jgi:cobalt-zinc-cadmium efflux system membrane fusion protein
VSIRQQLLTLTGTLLLAAALAAAAVAATAAPAARAAAPSRDDGSVTVQAQAVSAQWQAYGRVEPIAPVQVRAASTGLIVGLQVRPGTSVRAGQKLAELTGSEIDALVTRSQADAHSTQAHLDAARQVLQIERQQLAAQLTTRQALAAAQSALAAAAAASDSAQSQLRAAQSMRTLRAPCTGIVLAVTAADGERVMAGQSVLTLQATNQLWLRADFYGADAAGARIGMTGQFAPSDGGTPIAVRVATVFGALAVDGGESVGLLAVAPAAPERAPEWLNGEAGTVTLDGPTRSMVSVPTRALILDQGRWWVLVRTARIDRAQPVVPGATRGWQTFIEQGLAAGQQVVVADAYLEYHRGIAGRYQPPDD